MASLKSFPSVLVTAGLAGIHEAEDLTVGRVRGTEALGATFLGLVRDGPRRPQGHPLRGTTAAPALPHPPETQASQLLPGTSPPASGGRRAPHTGATRTGEEDGRDGKNGQERRQRGPGSYQEEAQEEEKSIHK